MCKDKKVFFITEGGLRIGLGHLMRCIAVAQHLRDLRFRPSFVVNNSPAVAGILKKYNFHFKQVPKIEQALARYGRILQNKPVLIDSKKDVSGLIRGLQNNGCQITLIDNITKARLWADNVIYPHQHFNPKRLNWEKARGKLFYGTKFFPLRKEFRKTRPKKKKNYILVSMGGTDFNNLTKLVLESLEGALPNIKIIAVVTKAFRHKIWLKTYKRKINENFEIIKEAKDFPKLLSRARLVITALGITVYEAAYFKIPTLVINNYKTDFNDSQSLEKLGFCKSLGFYRNLNSRDIAEGLRDLLFLKSRAAKLKSKMLPDENGAGRIASLLL